MVALAAPRVLFVIVMDACCGLLVRRLGPCLWAAGISCQHVLASKSGDSSAIHLQHV